MTSPDYGIQAFLWWRPEVASRDLGLIQDMGFRWAKQVFSWADIEGAEKNHFNWTQSDQVVQLAEDAGIKLLARLDRAPAWTGAVPPNGPPQRYEDYGDFCFEVAKRYKGRIHAYQIWNEPNLAREWGDKPPNAREYTQMLKKAYQAIKAVDPNAIVVTAAASHVPPPLIQQLKPGGRMIIPVGSHFMTQQLLLVTKSVKGEVRTRQILPVAFVPLTGGH